MTFEELQKELFERGFGDLNDGGVQLARVKRWINSSYQEILDWAAWPFLEETKEGFATPSLAIADLQQILDVSDLTHDEQLDPADRRELVSIDANLSSTGNPERWYLEGGINLKVYPASPTSKLGVRYVKVAAKLVNAGDQHIIPEKYEEMIVEGAVIRAYRNRDNYEAAGLVRSEWKLAIVNMEKALLKKNRDKSIKILRTGRRGDYL